MGTDNLKPGQTETEPRRKPMPWRLLAIAAAVVAAVLTFNDVIEWVGGEPQLKKKREEQLAKEQKEIDEAEQYALLALTSQHYPCLKCPAPVVFLRKGEVWKYGVTRKGEKGRYTVNYLEQNYFEYFVQFRGTLSDCLKEEKAKIFRYPLLLENLVRPAHERLAKPPGNLRTD